MKNLEQAYLETDYIVYLPRTREEIVLKVNDPHPKTWINIMYGNDFHTYLYITAANPCSGLAEKRENHKRNYKLARSLEDLDLFFFFGHAKSKDRTWTELSFCVFNVTREFARNISFFFAQNAYIFGARNKFPELCWTLPDERIKRINK
jgi:hypothetical protein